jgi:nucleoside-diphosphate-sugar epimerase
LKSKIIKILIIGGTGFIGYHLSKRCLKNNWEVTSISTSKPKNDRLIKNVKYILCDISKKNLLKKKIKKNYDYVVNLGGYVDHSNKIKTFNSHYVGCKNLADIFIKKKITTFVQMGSSLENGNKNSPQTEAALTKTSRLRTVYSNAKLKSSIYLSNMYKKKKFPVVIFRLYLAYGPGQSMNRFLPIIINGCLKNKTFPTSHGRQMRDFIYIDDVIEAIMKSLTIKNAVGKILNLGTGKPQKLIKIINQIIKICKGGKADFGKVLIRNDEILNLYSNIRYTRSVLKWKPNTTFKKGLLKTINFYVKKNERFS